MKGKIRFTSGIFFNIKVTSRVDLGMILSCSHQDHPKALSEDCTIQGISTCKHKQAVKWSIESLVIELKCSQSHGNVR